jgi:uncharacterized protein (DUF433 family)
MKNIDYITFHSDDKEPFIKGHRIAVRTIAEFYKKGVNLKGIEATYPTLTKEEILAAITYYDAHKEEVEKFIEMNK